MPCEKNNIRFQEILVFLITLQIAIKINKMQLTPDYIVKTKSEIIIKIRGPIVKSVCIKLY